MMKVLLDTNVLLDVIASREPFRESAEKIFMLAAEGVIDGYITATSITDIYYIARKNLSDTLSREALRHLFCVFSIVDVLGDDCEAALDLPIEDFEDALVATYSRKTGVNYIITRDDDFLKTAGIVPVISPTSFLEKIS